MPRGFTNPEEINDGEHPGPSALVLHNQITFVRTKLVPLGHLRRDRFGWLLHQHAFSPSAQVTTRSSWLLVARSALGFGVIL